MGYPVFFAGDPPLSAASGAEHQQKGRGNRDLELKKRVVYFFMAWAVIFVCEYDACTIASTIYDGISGHIKVWLRFHIRNWYLLCR